MKASPAGRWLGVEADCAGRFGVELSVPRMNGIYALGDTALSLGENNTPLPGL